MTELKNGINLLNNVLSEENMGKISVKTVVAIGIGAALMFVLMRFVAIPSGVPNTTLNLGIAIIAIFAAIFGPIAGLLIGFIGHLLNDLTAGWGGWWTWVIGSALFGLAVGFFWKLYKIEEGGFGIKQCLFFNGIQIAANLVIWVAIAPTLDILVYQEPADKVYLQGLVSAGLNIVVVLVLGSLLAFGYSKTRTKAGSLKKE
jgi:energy-coupling factor transport system substrate-specific component